MLSVYGLTANGRRDPMATGLPVTLSWRLGAEGAGCDQAGYRVRVTSVDTSELVFDTGPVAGSTNHVSCDCVGAGGTYVWFVELADTAGDTSCSAPAAFRISDEEGEAGAEEPICVAVLATEDGVRLYHDPTLAFLSDDDWVRLTGLGLEGAEADLVRCRVPASGPARVRASLLAPRGLVVLTLRRSAHACRLTLSLAPGMRAEVEANGTTFGLSCGIHTLDL